MAEPNSPISVMQPPTTADAVDEPSHVTSAESALALAICYKIARARAQVIKNHQPQAEDPIQKVTVIDN